MDGGGHACRRALHCLHRPRVGGIVGEVLLRAQASGMMNGMSFFGSLAVTSPMDDAPDAPTASARGIVSPQ
jgi:hypothetical protein